MNLPGKFTDWNDVPWPLLPGPGQKVASMENSELPSLGCRWNWKLWGRRELPGLLIDSNETQFGLARPAASTKVASCLSVVELPAVTGATTTRSSESSCLRRSEERRVGKECRSRWSPY